MASTTYDGEKLEPKVSATIGDLPAYTHETIGTIHALVAEDHEHEIKLRTMSWQKAAWLLCGDQVCLAIMAQTWSLSVLGWAAGIITMIKDICDFAYYACGKSKIAYEFAGAVLLVNNILLIGFHVFTGAKVLNTRSDHNQCTVVFSVIVMLMGIVMSIPRTLKHVSFMSMFSAACMGLAILLFMIFAGIEPAPYYGYGGYYPELGEVKSYTLPPAGTTFVAAMNAVLNITFLWVPQILFPTFIAEMEKPQDFPKSLAVLTSISAFLFIVPPAIGFRYLGQYSTAPAFGSLGVVSYKKASFAFVIVPTLVIGVIYANVTAKWIYFRVMGTSRHAHSNTIVGWGVWVVSGSSLSYSAKLFLRWATSCHYSERPSTPSSASYSLRSHTGR